MTTKIMNTIKFILFMTFALILTYPGLAAAASEETNLVANPGFESGSNVPLNWMFVTNNGYTPVWDTISHNGVRSIKISIPGTTLSNSGYPLSDPLILEPMQTYTFSAWVKSQGVSGCPYVRVEQYDANWKLLKETTLEFCQGTNEWTQKQKDFQTLPNSAHVYVYAFIWSGYGTFWVDDMELRLKSTSVSIPVPIPTPTPTPTQTPEPSPAPTPASAGGAISINPDKTISVGGKKTFPVFMDNICNAHYELNTGVMPCNPSNNGEFLGEGAPNHYSFFDINQYPALDYKNKFEKANMFFRLDSRGIGSIPQSLIDSPYLFGYSGIDEPNDVDMPSVSNTYEQVKARDPNHPVILDAWRDMVKWSPYTDIITWDTYPFQTGGWVDWQREDSIYSYEFNSENNFFQGTDINAINKPVWAVLQANGIPEGHLDGAYRVVPTPKEVRANTYTAITMDVKGIGFWGYLIWGDLTPTSRYPLGTPGLYTNPTLHAYYKQIARELRSFNDILVLPTEDYSWEYRKGTIVSFSKTLTKDLLWRTRTNFNYILKQSGSTTYLIVVNKDSRPISDVGITISGITGAMTAKTLGLESSGSGRAGRVLSVNNGLLTDSFDGYAVHIYQVS